MAPWGRALVGACSGGLAPEFGPRVLTARSPAGATFGTFVHATKRSRAMGSDRSSPVGKREFGNLEGGSTLVQNQPQPICPGPSPRTKRYVLRTHSGLLRNAPEQAGDLVHG